MQTQPWGAAAGLQRCQPLLCCSAHSTDSPAGPQHVPQRDLRSQTPDTNRGSSSARVRADGKDPAAGIWELFAPRKGKTGRQEGQEPGGAAAGLSPGLAAVPVSPSGVGLGREPLT